MEPKLKELHPIRPNVAALVACPRFVRDAERAGFSLVEVTIAIGLLAFCMVSVMGLLPVAMNISRDAMDRNIEAYMLQTVRADLQGGDYSALGQKKVFLFNTDGILLPSGAPDPASGYFQITAYPATNTALPPDQTAAYLKTVRLDILRQPQNRTNTRSLHFPDNGF